MTALIGSLLNAASSAVDRLTGAGSRGIAEAQGSSTAREFATLLAAMSSPQARAQASRSQSVAAEGVADSTNADTELTSEEMLAQLAALLGSTAVVTAADVAAMSEEELAALEAASAEALAAAEAEDARAAALPNVSTTAAVEAGTAAAGGAASTAAVAAPAPTSVDKNIDRLQPEFRRRLDRVIDRMEEEFGHTVTVVEAVRSQDRQNYLYEQGRTRPGNVVTWTRNSNHLDGRAVDVMIDGTYKNAAGYERLAQIAAQEGLNTLGPRDPGHLELPRNVEGGGMPQLQFAAAAPATNPADAPVGPMRLAQVARVATVAQIARVAEVARVADPTGVTSTIQSPQGAPNAESAAAVYAARIAQGAFDGQQGNSDGRRQEGSATALEMELLRGDASFNRAFSGDAVSGTQLTTGSDAVQRAAQILAMKEGGSTAPINHLMLRLDGANGGEDRIRVDLRGSTIDTTLNIENSAEAELLASRAGELRQSLERVGLEAEAVRVRTSTVTGVERVEVARATLAAAEAEAGRGGNRSGSDSSTKQEGWKDAQEQQRRASSEWRHRSRKEQQPKQETA